MNRRIYLVILLLILTLSEETTAQAQWKWLAGTFKASSFIKCVFPTEMTGYVIDVDGVVIKTTDGGKTFFPLIPNHERRFREIFFVDSLYGWILTADRNLLRTTNGGEDWQTFPITIFFGINNIAFSGREIGWASNSDAIYKTTDAGKTWQQVFRDYSIGPGPLTAINSQTCISYSISRILRTTDGGVTWNIQSFPFGTSIREMNFADERTGFVLLYGGNYPDSSGLIKTTDGGETWRTLRLGSGFNSLYLMKFADSTTGIARSDNSLVLTRNGGLVWYPVLTLANNYIQSISIKRSGRICAVSSYSSVYLSTDYGANWQITLPAAAEDYSAVAFSDRNNGIIAGSNGAILRTTDGGSSWVKINSGVNAKLTSIFRLDRNTEWIAGNSGVLLRTLNGGSNWEILNSGTSSDITNTFFITANEGWITTLDGKILKTTDGGLSWIAQFSRPGYSFYHIQFLDQLKGWASGSGGKYFTTSDGGNNWLSHVEYLGSKLLTVQFLDELNGLIMSDRASVWKTTDGGINWVQLILPGPLINAIYYVDKANIVAACYNGLIYRSYNGGIDWERYATVSKSDINDICLLGGTGYAVGNWGVILKTQYQGLQLTYPKPGLVLTVGATKQISWYQDTTKFVNIDYSTNGGNTWINIATNYSAELQSFSWTIPNTPSDRCLIRVIDVDNPSLTDTIDGEFKIVVPSLSLKNPRGGERWPIGYRGYISWRAFGTKNINILLTRDDGNSWNLLYKNFPVQPDSIVYTFSDYDTSSQCRIKIVDVEIPTLFDSSPGLFSIVPRLPFALKLLSPPPENINIQQPVTLRWSVAADADRYELILSGDADFSTFVIKDTNITGTSKLCPPLQHYKNYYWKVRGWNSSGAGPFGSSFFSTALITIPAPTNLTATRTAPGTVELNWTDNSPNEEIFSIYRKKGLAGSALPFDYLNSMPANFTSCTDVTLNDDSVYSYVVHGWSRNIFSPASNTVTVYPPAAIGEGKEIPKEFELYQNYPNPFNPVTTIRYGVPVAGFVTLEVFDPLGRKISTPVNGYLNEGYYTINFTQESLSSGVYVYVLKANNKETGNPVRIVKKMIYLR